MTQITTINSIEELEKVSDTDEELEYIKQLIVSRNKDYTRQFNNILELVAYCCPSTWEQLFYDNIKILKNINTILKDKIFIPETYKVLNVYYTCPLQNIKVVILGQDPYPTNDTFGFPYATGLAFSVRQELQRTKWPSSLKNIIKELENEYRGQTRNNGCLLDWSNQGVFLLNTCLTVKPNEPDSHKDLWFGFIQKTLETICQNVNKCIFVLWGQKAQKIEKYLTNGAIVLKAAHPSGYSANKGFIGCNHFKLINEHLITLNKTPIIWL